MTFPFWSGKRLRRAIEYAGINPRMLAEQAKRYGVELARKTIFQHIYGLTQPSAQRLLFYSKELARPMEYFFQGGFEKGPEVRKEKK